MAPNSYDEEIRQIWERERKQGELISRLAAIQEVQIAQIEQNAQGEKRNREDIIAIKAERGAVKWVWPILLSAFVTLLIHLVSNLFAHHP